MEKLYHKYSDRHIDEQHFTEWRNSGVDEEIIKLNVRSLSWATAMDHLLYSPDIPRNSHGRVCNWIMQKYNSLGGRGWYCTGVDLSRGGREVWGQVKFDAPRTDKLGKTVKYESPILTSSQYYALEVGDRLNQQITGQREIEMWQWAIDHPEIPLYITEGSKKAGSLLTYGKLALGLPGISSGYRHDAQGKKLIEALQLFAQGGREIIFAYDCNEGEKTQKAVDTAILNTGRLFKQAGCPVSYLHWEQHKGIDDYLRHEPSSSFPHKYPLNKKAVDLRPELSLDKIDLTLNEQWLSLDNTPIDWDADVIGIKSAKGTAKTTLLTKIKKSFPQRKTLIISFRQQLARFLAEKFGVPYRRELDEGENMGYSLCIDSLHEHANPPFNPNHWAGAIIIMDELEAVIWHLLAATTCAKVRTAIIRCLQELIKVVLTTGGKIIVADADLSSVSLDFLLQGAGDSIYVKTQIIHNLYTPKSKNIQLYNYPTSSPDLLIENLCHKLSQGEKILLTCGAAKVSSFYSTKSLKTFFQKRFPQLRIGTLDADTTLNCSLSEYAARFDLLIVSPAIESGISLEDNYFDSIWTIAQGSQSPNSIAQTLARDRSSVPRHIWCNYRGLIFIANGEVNPNQILATTEAKAVHNLKLLNRSLSSCSDNYSLEIKPSSAVITWAKYAAWHNYQAYYYREFVLAKLEKEYNLIDIEGVSQTKYKAEIGQARQENIKEFAEVICQIDLQNHPSSGINPKLVKYRLYLEETYGAHNINPELVIQDYRGELNKFKLHYYLQNPNSQTELYAQDHSLVNPDFSPDSAFRLLIDKVALLKSLQIDQFLNQANNFTSQKIASWFDKLKLYRRDLKRYYNFSFGIDEQPIKVAQRLLKFFLGVSLTFIGKRGKRGHQERHYQGYALSPERNSIFDYWQSQ